MTPEEASSIVSSVPSWMDGKGLFPDYEPTRFPEGEGATVTRNLGSSPPRIPADAARVSREPDNDQPRKKLPADYPLPQAPSGCPTSGTVSVVFSGVNACGCVITGGASSSNASFSGLNGAHTLTWDSGSSTFILSGVGSVTVNTYVDLTCTLLGSTRTTTFDLVASCSGGNWTVTASVGGVFAFAFLTITTQPMGSAIANGNICTGVTSPIGDGTATVS